MDLKKAVVTTVLTAGIVVSGVIGFDPAVKLVSCTGRAVQFDYANKYYCASDDGYLELKNELSAEYNREKLTEDGEPFDFDINYMQLVHGAIMNEIKDKGLTGEITDKALFEQYLLTK